MAESPSKVQVRELTQIAIAVNDLHMVADYYRKILGIGPWAIYDWEYPKVFDRTYRGKPSFAKEKIAIADVGGVELELMQPIGGDSIYRDFIDEHGEGLHHLQFKDENVEEVARVMSDQ